MIIVVPILQMEELRHRVVKQLAKVTQTGSERILDLNSGKPAEQAQNCLLSFIGPTFL